MTQALHCDSQYHSFWTHRQPGCRCRPTPFVLLSANTADRSATRRSNCRRQRRALHRLSAFNSKHEGPTESQKAPGLLDKISDQRGSGQALLPEAPRFPTRWLSVLSSAGAGITGYLTWAKFLSAPVVCPSSGSCDSVLSSDYATVFGLPLSLLGFLTYSAVSFLSLRELISGRPHSDSTVRPALLLGGAVLASTSSYLLYILVMEFPGETCTWCLASAALSIAILVLAAQGLPPRELSQASKPAGGAAVGVIAALAVAWSGAESPKALADLDLPYQEVRVKVASSDKAVTLARRLKEAGAHMYGAFWCSHCQEQKAMFGKQAQADLPYVECFPQGWHKGVKMEPQCAAADIKGFPLWVIGGQRYEGERTFDQLETALNQDGSASSNS